MFLTTTTTPTMPTTQKPATTPTQTTIVFENGTMIGAVTEANIGAGVNNTKYLTKPLIIPEIVISASYSSTSLNRSRCDINNLNTNNTSNVTRHNTHTDDMAAESTALLDAQQQADNDNADDDNDNSMAHNNEYADSMPHDVEFEEFVLNRSTSESNMLDSSIYSELQFPPSLADGMSPRTDTGICTPSTVNGAIVGPAANTNNHNNTTETGTGNGTGTGITTTTSTSVVDMLNTSACSRTESRQSKRSRRKLHKTKSKCNVANTALPIGQRTAPVGVATNYPPQYTAIFLDPHHQRHHHHLHHHHQSGGGAANAMGQIASAAASSPFLNANIVADATGYHLHQQQQQQQHVPHPHLHHHHHHQQQFQYYQQRPMLSSLGHHQRRNYLDATVPVTAGTGASSDALNAIVDLGLGAAGAAGAAGGGSIVNTTVATTLTTPPQMRISFRKWFSRPSLPFVIGILALGGVACTLGGIVLGSTGLIEHSTQYLSAALLMIGIGVSLLVISGAIWRLSLPDDVDECPCYRHMETCRNCNSPYCTNRLMPGNYLYPEFQHRPPPPSYLTSLNECATMGFLFHPTANAQQTGYSTLRMNTPPPLYRSTNSLNAFVPLSNAVTANTTPNTHGVTNVLPSSTGLLPEQSAIMQTQSQNMTKEINYLDLD